MAAAVPDAYADVSRSMRVVAERTLEISSDIELLFITNLQQGEIVDVGAAGVMNTAQYYSRRQADEIIRSLQNLGLTVRAFYSEREFIDAVARNEHQEGARRKVVFTTAEGGTGAGRRALIPALCNLLSLPFMKSGAHACSLSQHKFHAQAVLRQFGVRVPGTWQFKEGRWSGDVGPPAGSRVIVKPAYESMSIGIDAESVRLVDEGFKGFVESRSRALGQAVVVQEFVSGEEVGVPIARVGVAYALPPIAFRRADGEPYGRQPKTFRDENLDGNKSHAPFDAPAAQREALLATAVRAFDILEMRGIGRIDFRVDADGRAWAFDISESPPPLSRTSYAIAMEQLGFSFQEMLAVWVGICLLDFGVISGVPPERELAARDEPRVVVPRRPDL